VKAILHGNTKSLRALAKKLRAVGSDQTLRHLADNLAQEGLEQVDEGFARQVNPYDVSWPKKVFPDGRAILVGSSTKLRRGWHRKYIGADGFIIASSAAYAKYQLGTGIYGPAGEPIRSKSGGPLVFLAARRITPKARKGASPIVPVGKRGAGRWGTQKVVVMSVKGSPPRLMVPNTKTLPPRWKRGMRAAAREFWAAHMAKR
jgi:hypothetical protein